MLIIFPIDETTTFLEEIIIYLYSQVHTSKFTLIKCGDITKEDLLKEISNSPFQSVAFFGHGTSNALGNNTTSSLLLKGDDFLTFKNKKILLVSCNSNVLLMNTRKYFFKEGIGFGDLPTDWNDVASMREVEVNAYTGVTDKTIEDFKKSLVDIIKYSIVDYLNTSSSFKNLYNNIRLRINKRLARNYKEDNGKEALNDILLLMKDECMHINVDLYY